MSTSGSLAGQTAVITGAGRGIGRAIACAFAAQGANVVCSSRTQAQIDDTVALIAAAGGRAKAFAADAGDHAAMLALFDHAHDTFGGVDIAVANAGVAPQNALLADSTPALWKQTIDINLTGVYYTAHAAIPHLRRRGGGKIICIGSGMGHRGAPTRSAYASSKAGLWMLVRVLAQELAGEHICVNEIVPGPVMTEFIAGRVQALRTATGQVEWFKQPEDVAPLAVFVAGLPNDGPTGQSYSLARREL